MQEANNPSPKKNSKKKKKPRTGKRGPKKKKEQTGPALHQKTITVKYNKTNKLSKPNGKSLKAAIEAAVPQGMHQYAEDKKKHLESTGYEEGYGTFQFSVEDERNISGLIDVSLGLKDCVEVKDPTFTPMRFGIVTRKDVSHQPTGWIAMPDLKPMSNGQLKFSNDETTAPLVFDVEVYNSPFNNSSHREFVKLRLAGEHFEIQLQPFIGKFQINFAINDGPIEIRQFHNLLRLMLLLEKADQDISMKLCIEHCPDFDFGHGGKPWG